MRNLFVLFLPFWVGFTSCTSDMESTQSQDSLSVLLEKNKDSLAPSTQGPKGAALKDTVSWLEKVEEFSQRENPMGHNDEEDYETPDYAASNDSLVYYLKKIFSQKTLPELHDSYTVSESKTFIVYSFFENTGGTFQSHTNVYIHRVRDTLDYIALEEGDLGVSDVYDIGPDRYVVLSSAATCSSCRTEIITEYRFKKGKRIKGYVYDMEWQRAADESTFEYDPEKKIFSSVYYPWVAHDSLKQTEEYKEGVAREWHQFK